jgi:hypothetical protein
MSKLFILLLSLISVQLYSQQNAKEHISESMINTTVRIEGVNRTKIKTGTALIYTVVIDSAKNLFCPLIITNRHVIDSSNVIKVYFKTQDTNGNVVYGSPHIELIPNDAMHVIQHPDNNVDLVAIPVLDIQTKLKKLNINLYLMSMLKSFIKDDAFLEREMKSIENVIMIGYPNGLWDTKNNLPIAREGITATMPYKDYNGKKEFLIDIAAFGGSSGSPVYLYREMYRPKFGKTGVIKTDLFLLGILYAGPTYNVKGKIAKINPTDPSNVTSAIPMNIGYVIKAQQLLEFDKIILDIFNKKKNNK